MGRQANDSPRAVDAWGHTAEGSFDLAIGVFGLTRLFCRFFMKFEEIPQTSGSCPASPTGISAQLTWLTIRPPSPPSHSVPGVAVPTDPENCFGGGMVLVLVGGGTLATPVYAVPLDLATDRSETAPAVIVEAADGTLIGLRGELRGTPAVRADPPDHLVKAIVAIEDRRFFDHGGIDFRRVARSLAELSRRWRQHDHHPRAFEGQCPAQPCAGRRPRPRSPSRQPP